MANEVTFEIKEHIGVLATNDNGWSKEINIVEWNNSGKTKVDIREWSPDHTRMTRGLTLVEDEAREMARLLAERYASGR